jgi:hypothetical protein
MNRKLHIAVILGFLVIFDISDLLVGIKMGTIYVEIISLCQKTNIKILIRSDDE